ncbi:MAG: ABC transporter permease [Acidobacteria bacterium]|nr:ABC transporter permease [Acidobacteriota bacterium]
MTVRAPWRRRRAGRTPAPDDVARELQSHLELEIEAQRDEGLSEADATRAAYRTFGNPTRVREDIRDEARWTWADDLARDVGSGVRHLTSQPIFTTVAALSLALGIGANIAVFNVSSSLLRRVLPVAAPDELVTVTEERDGNFSYPAYVALRQHVEGMADLVAASSVINVNVDAAGSVEPLDVKLVSGNYFSVLRVPPASGRIMDSADEQRAVAVISQAWWTRRFARSPDVVGKVVTIAGVPFTVIGVAPSWFTGETVGEAPDVWASVVLRPAAIRNEPGFTWLYVMGRISPPATREQLAAAMAAGGRTISRGDSVGLRIAAEPGARGLSRTRTHWAAPLTVLTVIVGLVLLVTCVNLAVLLLTRSAARRGDIAVRLSLGATRERILRALMIEHLLLGLLGGAAGLAVGLVGSQLLVTMAADVQPLSLDVQLRASTVWFTLGTSIAAVLLFGGIPAWRASRESAVALISRDSRWIVGRSGGWHAREGFIVFQLAVSFVLVAAGTVFVQTLRNLQAEDLGFDADRVLALQFVPDQGYRPPPDFLSRVLGAVSALPGVEIATVATAGPLSEQGGGVNGLQVPGFTANGPEDLRARADWVGPGYFKTSGIRLVTGRDFSAADDANRQPVAIVNETWARYYFGTTAVIGRRFWFNKKEYEIAGVAQDTKYTDLRAPIQRFVYFALLQGGSANRLFVRAAVPPATLAAAARRAVATVDRRVSVRDVVTMAEVVDRRLARERLLARLAGVFGGLTLLLVSIGIYGTVAQVTTERATEIGLRLALGATRTLVTWQVLRRIVVMLAAGLALGAIGVYGAGPLVATLLYGISPVSVTTMVVTIAVLGGVALAAGWLPAVQASRFDLAAILRR